MFSHAGVPHQALEQHQVAGAPGLERHSRAHPAQASSRRGRLRLLGYRAWRGPAFGNVTRGREWRGWTRLTFDRSTPRTTARSSSSRSRRLPTACRSPTGQGVPFQAHRVVGSGARAARCASVRECHPSALLLLLEGLLACCFAIPRDNLPRDSPIAAPPLAAHPLRPSFSPQIVEKVLDVDEGCAFVKASGKDEELRPRVRAKAVLSERIPVLPQQAIELLGP